MSHLDGNALAGPTSDLFAFDLTTTSAQCATCSDVAVLARALVYGPPMGFVVRCRNCAGILMVIVDQPEGRVVNVRGLRWMRTPSTRRDEEEP